MAAYIKGEFKNGKPEEGTVTLINNVQKGYFKNGLLTIIIDGNGTYEGEFKHGKLEGQGTLTYAKDNIQGYTENSKYVGGFKDGKREGHGILYYANGNKYDGDFKNDMRDGQGTIFYKKGSIYVGEFKGGDCEHGILTCADTIHSFENVDCEGKGGECEGYGTLPYLHPPVLDPPRPPQLY